jgi:hypothetical protein
MPHPLIYDIPVIGDDLAQIGHVIDLSAQCGGTDAYLSITAMFHALPTLLISLTKPELVDVDIKHGKRRPRRGKFLRFIVDGILQGEFKTFNVPRTWFAQLGEWSQRLGWYMLVADATSDFLLNWTSMTYQWQGCDAVPLTPFWVREEGPNSVAFQDTAGSWSNFIHGITTESHEATPTAAPGGMEIHEDCFPRFTFQVQTKVWPSEPDARVTSWRIITLPGTVWGEWRSPQGGDHGVPQYESTLPFTLMPAGSQFFLQYIATGHVGVEFLKWTMHSTVPGPVDPVIPDP